ncbi:MAG: hypothetical protein AUJ92_14695 [Armatimonadetes bacterium CG2_30_59_28]|nr:hypothetical protein [Armatimonadota bacterium]OIO92308.1 MAG: hypothetical protein AUJ92_14695 [Armatimonadetes bacterium CG2_30_59_28]PIU65289.1 MAG: hypothetical protein COS85_09215 [Armatimonadetes bacterium CG07_land_8_20_14_0_80_59_28]PIX44500.1 MAG: hypothetical protein COZ56_04410 [Armatimonadetes bacterium CG_4_8_14_3_um_filter_58_9]PIY40157.1 MAG: hypothetical protein COZ05_18130 [Armatimonadetes bacterium CG_4_10_14_3_um_filter_59_10]
MNEENSPTSNLTGTETTTDTPSGASTGKHIAKATGGIMIFHVLRFMLGFMEKPLIAHYFGTTSVADAYTVARDIVNRIWLIFEKVVNPSFLPCFIQSLKDDGEERAWSFTNTVATIMTALLVVTITVAWFITPPLVNFYTRNPQRGEIELTILLTRTMIFGLLFLGLSSLTYVILNGYKRFALAAMGDTIWKGSILAAVVFGVPYLLKHSQGLESVAVVALAVGFLVGSFGKLLPQLIGLYHKRHLFRFSVLWDDPTLRRMGLLIPPLLAGIIVSEFRGMMMVKFANAPQIGEGGRAALNQYSRPLIDALIFIFPYAMSIAIFPYLSQLHVSKEKQAFTDTFMGALRVCAFFFIPLTVGFIMFCQPIIRAVFEGGKFGAESLALTVGPFVCFSAGMVFFASETIVNQTWYSTANTLVPNTVGIVTSLLAVLFAWCAVETGHGLEGIALSETLAKSTKVIILIFLLRGCMANMRLRKQGPFLLKVLVSSAALAAFGSLAMHVTAPIWTAEYTKLIRIERLAAVAVTLGGGLLVHIAVAKAIKIEEAEYVIEFVRKRMKRG